MRAAIYARLSEDRTGQAESVDEQVRKARRYVSEHGWSVAGLYTDRNKSASQYARGPRPAYQQMMGDLAASAFDVIVCVATDRLYRRPRELEDLIDQSGVVPIHAVRSGPLDLTSPEGKTNARIFAAINAGESDKTAARVREAMARLATNGHANGGGSRLYGYRLERVPDSTARNGERNMRVLDPDEAAVVREVAKRLLAGETMAGVARDLNARDIPTAGGKRWTVQGLKALMTRPALAGLREHNGTTLRAQWEPILSEADHARLVKRLATKRRPGRPASYPASGVLTCHACDGPLTGERRSRDGVRQYGCRACHKTVISAEVEDTLRDLLRAAVKSGAIRKRARKQRGDRDASALLDEIGDLETREVEIGLDYDDGRISRSAYIQRLDRLRERLTVARASLGRVSGVEALGPLTGSLSDFDAYWQAATPDQQRAALRAVFKRVEVGPAVRGRNRLDESRLRPEWAL